MLKRERKLKRWMKILITDRGLNASNWRYLSYSKSNLVIMHKHSTNPKCIALGDKE